MRRYLSITGQIVLAINFISFLCIYFSINFLFENKSVPGQTPEKVRLLLKLKAAGEETIQEISRTIPGHKISRIFTTTSNSELNHWYKLTTAKTAASKIKLTLQRHPDILTVEQDLSLSPSLMPNDENFPHQWALNTRPGLDNNYRQDIGIMDAWNMQTGSHDVIVAVLDTGVDYHHEDLRDNMWINEDEYNGTDNYDDDGNGCVDDIYGCDFRSNVIEKLGYAPGLGGAYYESEKYMRADGMGHGTLVAGVIGAVGNNNIGISGINWNTRIMAVKFINQNNAANMVDAAVAIKYAVDNGAKIINNSYGKNRLNEFDMQILKDTIQYAHDNGVLLVAAAGNNGFDIDRDRKFYPANFQSENLITVAALNRNNELWEYSNHGHQSVDLAAPGVDILSTAPKGPKSLFRKYYDPSGYMTTEGTSIAAPVVTGVAALICSHYPHLSHLQVRSILLNAVDDIPALHHRLVTGGKINADKALKLARQQQ